MARRRQSLFDDSPIEFETDNLRPLYGQGGQYQPDIIDISEDPLEFVQSASYSRPIQNQPVSADAPASLKHVDIPQGQEEDSNIVQKVFTGAMKALGGVAKPYKAILEDDKAYQAFIGGLFGGDPNEPFIDSLARGVGQGYATSKRPMNQGTTSVEVHNGVKLIVTRDGDGNIVDVRQAREDSRGGSGLKIGSVVRPAYQAKDKNPETGMIDVFEDVVVGFRPDGSPIVQQSYVKSVEPLHDLSAHESTTDDEGNVIEPEAIRAGLEKYDSRHPDFDYEWIGQGEAGNLITRFWNWTGGKLGDPAIAENAVKARVVANRMNKKILNANKLYLGRSSAASDVATESISFNIGDSDIETLEKLQGLVYDSYSMRDDLIEVINSPDATKEDKGDAIKALKIIDEDLIPFATRGAEVLGQLLSNTDTGDAGEDRDENSRPPGTSSTGGV